MKKAIIICWIAIMAFNFFSCQVAPSAKPASLKLDRTEAVLGRDMNLQLHAEIVSGSAGDGNLEWISSNTSVAEVTSAGLVAAKLPGTATITVSLKSDGEASAQCLVTVKDGYMVSFDTKGGSPVESRIVGIGSLVTPPDPAPTKLGYVFHSWCKDANLTVAWVFAANLVTATTTLYARWNVETYSISYTLNGGSLIGTSIPYSYTVENSVSLPQAIKTSSYFAGWFDNANFSGTPVGEIPSGQVGDRTFYAKFLAARTVTFNSNNPTNQSQSYTAGETTIFDLKPNMFIYPGYTFLGWSRNAASATPEFVLPASITIGSSNETFYAVWACEYLFTIENNEATITGLSGAWTPVFTLNLPSVLGGKSVTKLGPSAFKGNTTITIAYIPGSVRLLGESCFQDCSNLEIVDTTTGLTELGMFAFRNCSKLASFSFPSSLASFTFYSFMGCSGLKSLSVAAGNSSFAVDSGVLYNASKTDLYLYPAAMNGTTFTVPNTVTRIATLAFGTCQNLTSIVVPASVYDIGRKSFWSTARLSSVQFLRTSPASLISDDAFDANPAGLRIRVPQAALNAYKTATYWSEYATMMIGVN